MGKKLNINPGDKFNRLTVIKEVEKKNKARFFLCKCDCGNEKMIRMVQLTNGQTKSCGCFKLEFLTNFNYRHGLSRTKIYHIWTSMKQRCFNEKSQSYHYYGECGITVCSQWKDFQIFEKWAKENGYINGLSLERKNVNKGYNPSNCKWIPRNEQANNTRSNILLTFKGKTQNVAQWAKELGFKSGVIGKRLKLNWSVEKALTTSIQESFQRFKHET